MRQFPPWLESLLQSMGVNTIRLKWKLHYAEEGLKKRWAALNRSRPERRYKACRECGRLALAEDKACNCGARLPSYTAYRISRFLALDRPDAMPVSIGFIGVIVGMFAWMFALDGPRALMSPRTETLYYFGALVLSPRNPFAPTPEWWRYFGFALGHFGVIHLLFNTIAISQMLPRFEREIGPWRSLFLVTLTQAGAAAASALVYPVKGGAFLAGASGIAFGLIGFGVTYAVRGGRRDERDFFVHWLIYGIAFSLLPRVSMSAHIGGLIPGLVLGYAMGGRPPRGWAKTAMRAAGILCLLLWLVVGFQVVRSAARGMAAREDEEASAPAFGAHEAARSSKDRGDGVEASDGFYSNRSV